MKPVNYLSKINLIVFTAIIVVDIILSTLILFEIIFNFI